jgi:predicted metal-dependent peptidase
MEARENAGLVQLPMFAKRALKEFKNPQTDWRIILNDLIQLDPTDYSFCPPDKRFPESPFLIPDFNDMQERIANVYFFVDTSASIGTDELTVAYSEIKGAIEQFNNAIQGKLAFFDSSVKEPIRDFSDVDDLVKIKPIGGGGTNFHDIFKFIKNKVKELPEMIIILTDGQASYPVQADAMGIPVLWLINNEKVTPPWGKVARVKV